MGNDHTIFDDVFRTMLERMPQLVIPVINEIFHTSYSEDEPIEQYRNEHHTKSGELITDSYLGICDKLYHLECESRPKGNMSIRMIEYDFAIALENAEQTDDIYEINFPHSCVLYLRHTMRTPDVLTVKVNLPDGRHFLYHTPTVKLQEYTKEEIFQKRLLFFLPFYIMRYEKDLPEIARDPEQVSRLLAEYEEIRVRLKKELPEDEEAAILTRLAELTERISDYILRSEQILREGLVILWAVKFWNWKRIRFWRRLMKEDLNRGLRKDLSRGLRKDLSRDLKKPRYVSSKICLQKTSLLKKSVCTPDARWIRYFKSKSIWLPNDPLQEPAAFRRPGGSR